MYFYHLQVLATRRLMHIPSDEFEKVMAQCFDVFSTWDDEYDKLQGLLRWVWVTLCCKLCSQLGCWKENCFRRYKIVDNTNLPQFGTKACIAVQRKLVSNAYSKEVASGIISASVVNRLPGRWFLTLSNPIFLPTACSPTLIYCGRERGWWITCWLKSVLHEEKCRTGSYSGAGEQTQKKMSYRLLQRSGEQTQKKKCRTSPDIRAEWENHNVGRGPT